MNHKSETYSFKFSVITAVYNVASYLSEAIESILCQDIGFKDSVELILVKSAITIRLYTRIISKYCTSQTEGPPLPETLELPLHPEGT